MENPTQVRIEDRLYKINTSWLVAIECNKIAKNTKIGDYERALAIIYTLYGEHGLNCDKDWARLLELAEKYLLLGKEQKRFRTVI